MSSIRTLLFFALMLTTSTTWAQIDIKGKVYGGARQANVGKSTVVEIGADNHDVLISAVYGGNDISGTIGYSENLPTVKKKEGNNITEVQLLDEALANGITQTAGENTKQYFVNQKSTVCELRRKNQLIPQIHLSGTGELPCTG